MPKEEMLTLLEAMKETGLSSTYLYLLLRSGRAVGEKDSNGRWWIPKSQVEQLRKRKKVG